MKVIPSNQWASHPLLWKVRQFRSDHDGLTYLAVEHPLNFDYELANKLEIQFRETGGEWNTAQYHESLFLAGDETFAWDHEMAYLETDQSNLEWQAIEHEAPIR